MSPKTPEREITITHVSKSFRTEGGANHVLRDVTLNVPPSCLYGLIGPGASGKSVLLKLLCGLLRPDTGTIVVDGDEITTMSETDLGVYRKKVGMLFQNNALFDHLTVNENMIF